MNWTCPTCVCSNYHPARFADDVPSFLRCLKCGGEFETEVEPAVRGSATPKQRAFLSFLGLPIPPSLTSQEASEMIDSIDAHPDPSLREQIWERSRAWPTERVFLHPDLYGEEFVHTELPDLMHTYVRHRITGAIGRLTKSKIQKVIEDLNRTSPKWWAARNRGDIFMDRLGLLFPACVRRG